MMNASYGSHRDEEHQAFVQPSTHPRSATTTSRRVAIGTAIALLGAAAATAAYVAFIAPASELQAPTVATPAATLLASLTTELSLDDKAAMTFDVLDVDGDGAVTKDEYLSRLRARRRTVLAKLEQSNIDGAVKQPIAEVIQEDFDTEAACVAHVFDMSGGRVVDKPTFAFVHPLLVSLCKKSSVIDGGGATGGGGGATPPPQFDVDGNVISPMEIPGQSIDGEPVTNTGDVPPPMPATQPSAPQDQDSSMTPTTYTTTSAEENTGDNEAPSSTEVDNGDAADDDSTTTAVDASPATDDAATTRGGGKDETTDGEEMDDRVATDDDAMPTSAANGDVETATTDEDTTDDAMTPSEDATTSGDRPTSETNGTTPTDATTPTDKGDTTGDTTSNAASTDTTSGGEATDETGESGTTINAPVDEKEEDTEVPLLDGAGDHAKENPVADLPDAMANVSVPTNRTQTMRNTTTSDDPVGVQIFLDDLNPRKNASDPTVPREKSTQRLAFEQALAKVFAEEATDRAQRLAYANMEVKKHAFVLDLIQECVTHAGSRFDFDASFSFENAVEWIKTKCLVFPEVFKHAQKNP